jgi:hypothetical protein
MTDPNSNHDLFLVSNIGDTPLVEAIERAMTSGAPVLAELPALTNVALGDPYLAEQLVALHQTWETRPQPARGLVSRLRTRLAWWLLGPEIQQINAAHATVVRIFDSLVVQLDQERAARLRIAEHLAYGDRPPTDFAQD